MYVVFALATFPAGWLGDRGYKRPMMYLFFTGCGVSAILVGLSGSDIGIMIGLASIGLCAAIFRPVAAFAQLPVGVMPDRFGGRRVLILIFLLQAIVLGITAQLDGFLAMLALLVAVTLMFAGIPITGWLPGRYVSNRWRSRAFAAEYVLSLGMGALAVPLIAFLIRSGIRFDTQYLLFAASAVAVVVAGTYIPTYIPAPKPTFKLQNTISN